jgi:hypothetical protein
VIARVGKLFCGDGEGSKGNENVEVKKKKNQHREEKESVERSREGNASEEGDKCGRRGGGGRGEIYMRE